VGLGGAAPATEGALAKLERVLPEALRAQVRALAASLIVDPPDPSAHRAAYSPIPPATTLLALATAAADVRRVTLTYGDRDGTVTTRPFDPYAVVYPANAAWYTVGHCHVRGAVRVFRIDRVVRVEPTNIPFVRPADFDPLAHVRRSLALLPAPWAVELVMDAPREEAERWAAPLFVAVTEERGQVILRCTATDLDWLARTLAGMPFVFRIRTPPELLDALGRVHARLGHVVAAARAAPSPTS
jgi:predicted DNA-binding transcriptional regulator YafY